MLIWTLSAKVVLKIFVSIFIGKQGNLKNCGYEHEKHISEKELDIRFKLGREIVEVRHFIFSDLYEWRVNITWNTHDYWFNYSTFSACLDPNQFPIRHLRHIFLTLPIAVGTKNTQCDKRWPTYAVKHVRAFHTAPSPCTVPPAWGAQSLRIPYRGWGRRLGL